MVFVPIDGKDNQVLIYCEGNLRELLEHEVFIIDNQMEIAM